MAVFTRVNVDPTGLSKGQEGAEAQQVDRSDEGEHGRPRARGLDEIPREIHHEDPCGGRQSGCDASIRNKARPRICYEIFVSTETGRSSREHQSSFPLRFGLTPALLRSLDVKCGAKLSLTDRKYSR